MTLVVERIGSALWLCVRDRTTDPHSRPLAKFASEDAAKEYQAAQTRAMCFAREVGRSGIG